MSKKKNWNRIPESLRFNLTKMQADKFLIGGYIELDEDVHQKIISNFSSDLPNEFSEGDNYNYMPEVSKGRYSKRNINGKEVRRIDLPKISKTIYMGERPIFGDWENGSFDLYQTRQVTQKDFIPGKELEIEVKLVKVIDKRYIYRISVYYFLSKDYTDDELLYVINLAQENFGMIDVIENPEDENDYLKHLSVEWDIFPPGKKDDDIVRILSKYPIHRRTEDFRHIIDERRDFLLSLPSKEPLLISGSSGMAGYFGLKVTDEIVVFENMLYGNAIFVIFKNWEELSKLPKNILLARHEGEYERIRHDKGWENKVKHILSAKLGL